MTFHRITLVLLYAITLAAVIYLVTQGGSYYNASELDRPHSELHEAWKPSGFIGHGIGIAGSLLMLILLLYSVRKRFRFMQKQGDIRYWLNYHIWMGITGPILVLFHTTFKFGGIVAVSFWSMVAVALSGVFGRYLYMQVPRGLSGDELSAAELEQQEKDFSAKLWEELKGKKEWIEQLSEAYGLRRAAPPPGIQSVVILLYRDLTMPVRYAKIRRTLRQSLDVTSEQLKLITKIAQKRALLERRAAFLQSAKDLLHHWHIFHRPFAAVMLIIMMVHVIVTIIFGYRWIF
jgi:hypothetical protein